MKVLLLGASGFIGSAVQRQRLNWDWVCPTRSDLDLMDIDQCSKFNADVDVIVNCAGFYGGLVFNKIHADKIMYKNTAMFYNIVDMVERIKPKKFIQIGSACIYPKSVSGVLTETDLTSTDFHESVIYSALAKHYQLKSLQEKKCALDYLILTNVYGPGESLDPVHSHFVGSVVNRLLSDNSQFTMMGTGEAVRDFLYINNAAEIICKFCELPTGTCEPVNVSTGVGNSIKELTLQLIPSSTNLIWGSEKDNGTLFKVLSNKKMLDIIGDVDFLDVQQGLSNTLEFYQTWLTTNDK